MSGFLESIATGVLCGILLPVSSCLVYASILWLSSFVPNKKESRGGTSSFVGAGLGQLLVLFLAATAIGGFTIGTAISYFVSTSASLKVTFVLATVFGVGVSFL